MPTTPGFELDGRFFHCESQKDVLITALAALGRLRPEMIQRLVDDFGRVGRHRHLVAASEHGVYPERPDLAHEVIEFLPGFFVGTNENADTKLEVLMRACRHAGLVYGLDFRVPCLEGDGSKRRQLETEFAVADKLGL